ncbi:MAG: MFS transporter [Chloroflexi bacterium]|nr:MFS transporter [Chloroflexota bacterium]
MSSDSRAAPIRFLLNNRPFIVIWLTMFISIAGLGMVSPLLPKFVQDMGASNLWVALIYSGYAFTQIPLMLVAGRLCDRFGKKPLLWLGLLVFVTVAIGYTWAPGYQQLFPFRLVAGVGAAMVIPTAYAYVGDLAPHGREGRYMGIFNIAMVLGFGAGPAIGGIIDDSFGMDATFITLGILSAVGCIMVFFLLPEAPASTPVVHAEPGARGNSFISVLKDGPMRGIIAWQLVWGLGYGAVLTFLPVFMTDMNATTAQIGIVISVRSILNGLMAYPFGRLADRANRATLVSLGMLAMIIGVFLIPSVGGFGPLVCLFLAMGTIETLATPAGNAITVERGRSLGMGSVMAANNVAYSLAMVAGSLGGAAVSGPLGVGWVFRCAAIVGLAGLAVFIVFARTGKRTPKGSMPKAGP